MLCGAEPVPEGCAGVQGAPAVHGAARGRRRGQGGAVRRAALLHRQGVAGNVDFPFYVIADELTVT